MRPYFKNRLALFTVRAHHELASERPCSSFHFSACYISETMKWGLMKFGIECILCKLWGELHFGLCRFNKLRILHVSHSEFFQVTKKLRTANAIVVRGLQNRLHSFLELVSGTIICAE